MRILMITPLYLPLVGGLEIFVSQLIAELRGRGYKIVVVTSEQTAATDRIDEVEGVVVHRLGVHATVAARDPAGILRIQSAFTRILTSFDPDVVHSHDVGPMLWMYRRAARRHTRPLLATVHSVITRHFEGSVDIQAGLLRDVDWVTGVSRAVVDDVVAFEPSVAARVSIVRNGIAPPREFATTLPAGPPRLLCVGRLVPLKRFDRALDALARLVPRLPGVRLAVAGDGPEAGALREQACRLGIDDHVDFLGFVCRARVVDLLDESTVVLMPSQFEGMPIVALEAAWAGRPIVATRAPGLDEAVLHDVTGVVVDDDGGLEALADAIERVAGDRALAQRLGSAARAFAERECSIATAADAYHALYQRLTGAG